MLTKRFLLTAVAGAAAMPIIARTQPARSAGLVHKYLMRGAVVGAEGNTLVVCVGRAEGAEVGQVFKVYRNTPRPGGGGKSNVPIFVRNEVGTVRIDAIVDDHYANGTRVSGEAKVNDIVELESSVVTCS